jgi:arylsulfatase A-like enzyme
MDWSATMLALGGAAPPAGAEPDGVSLLPVLADPAATFEREMAWRMLHRGQRALRHGDWKYLQVDGHEYLFDLAADERERANQARAQPERLAAMRAQWLAWNSTFPAVPPDATVSLVSGPADMPAR